MPAGRELRRIIQGALSDDNRAFEELDVGSIELEDSETESPRWPSGIQAVQHQAGGFYGFTAVAGKKKLGKTLIAARSSIEAAQQGWNVHYAYGENTADRVRSMVRRVLGPYRASEMPPWMERNWRGFRFFPGSHIDSLMKNVVARIPDEADRVLIVIDSINRLARYSHGDYLRALGRICAVCQTAAEESAGHIGFLVLSELNQRGGMVGLDIEHSAGCLLTLRATRKPERVKLTLESRESPGGDLGPHLRRWDEVRFAKELEEVAPEPEKQQEEFQLF